MFKVVYNTNLGFEIDPIEINQLDAQDYRADKDYWTSEEEAVGEIRRRLRKYMTEAKEWSEKALKAYNETYKKWGYPEM